MRSLEAGQPLAHGDLTLVPIEETAVVQHRPFDGGFCVSAFKRPVAVVVVHRAAVEAIAVSGDRLDAARMASSVAGLRETLSSLSAPGPLGNTR